MTVNPEQSAASFFDDVPAPAPRLPVFKEQLATPHTVTINGGEHKRPILDLARTLGYHTGNVNEVAQTVYMLIDDITPAGGEVQPMLAEVYQTVIRAKRLLDEANTHLLRYANYLDNVKIAEDDAIAALRDNWKPTNHPPSES